MKAIPFLSHGLLSPMMSRVFILLLTVFMISCKSQSQITAPTEKIDGKSYYMHTVEKGQTLYSISKLYNCDLNKILEANPGTDSGIKEGQVLKIPAGQTAEGNVLRRTIDGKEYVVHTVQRKETLFSIARQYNIDVNRIVEANPEKGDKIRKGDELLIPTGKAVTTQTASGKMTQHTVRKGETLYSISKQYAVTVEAVQQANPAVTENLKEGQVLNIPTRALPNDHSGLPEPPGTQPTERPDAPISIIGGGKKSQYQISIMLPFYLDAPDSTLSDRERLFRDASVHLYRGIQLAADSLEKKGFAARFVVNDVIDSKASIKHATEDVRNQSSDLIIGPAYKEGITEMTTLSNKTGAHIVVPFPLTNKALLNSQNISKACPSSATVWEFMGRFIAGRHAKDNVILVHSSDIEDARQVQVFSQAFLNTKKDSVKLAKTTAAISGLLSASQQNIVVVPTSDRKLVTAVFDHLKNTNAIVYGTDEWETLDAITAEQRNKYHVRFPKTIYLDYGNETDQEWIEAFRKRFKTEPSTFAVLGYDLMLYYGEALQNYGRDFPNYFRDIQAEGLIGAGFDYFKTGSESGFENRHCIVLETEDFELHPVR